MKTERIAKFCFLLQLHRLAYFLNRKRKRTITFHNVLDDDVFIVNVANGVSNSFSSFKRIIDEIEKKFSFSLDLDDPSTVTITFDDGYANQIEIAAPYLISKKISAYLFVSGQLIKTENTVDEDTTANTLIIDKLLHWISFVPSGDYEAKFQNNPYLISVTDDNRNHVWSSIIWPLFISDCESKGKNLFDCLDKMYPYSKILVLMSSEYKKQRLQGVTEGQLNMLKDAGWQIGWHTLSHYPVAKLSSQEKVSELTPLPICDSTVFSFPYGGISDADNESFDILKTQGFKAAVSNINCGNSGNWKYYRSRMSLSDNPVLLHFELSGLKYMLKYKRLLPKI